MNPVMRMIQQLQVQIEGACAQIDELASRMTICSLKWSPEEAVLAETTLDLALARLETLEARKDALLDGCPSVAALLKEGCR